MCRLSENVSATIVWISYLSYCDDAEHFLCPGPADNPDSVTEYRTKRIRYKRELPPARDRRRAKFFHEKRYQAVGRWGGDEGILSRISPGEKRHVRLAAKR